MSLRLRPDPALYHPARGALLLFGALVYGLVSLLLVQQVDATLPTGQQIRKCCGSVINGQFDPALACQLSPDQKRFHNPGVGQRSQTADRTPRQMQESPLDAGRQAGTAGPLINHQDGHDSSRVI